MAIKTLDAIKAWFKTGSFPTESQFSDVFDSFRHKSDPIDITQSIQAELDKKADQEAFSGHIDSELNPHNVTKAQVGLSDVDNTTDDAKPVSIAQANALDLKADKESLPIAFADTSTPSLLDYQLTYADKYGEYPTITLFIFDGPDKRIKRSDEAYFNYVADKLDSITFDLGVPQTGFIIIKN